MGRLVRDICSIRYVFLLVFGSILLFPAFTVGEDPIPSSLPEGPPLTRFSLDKGRSSVTFTVTHMVISEVEGVFKVFNGNMEFSKSDYSDAQIDFSVDVKSVDTDNQNRDKHLKGPDFFDAGKFPLMRFVSTSFVHEEGKNYKLEGNLTIKAVTRPVNFTVTYAGLSSDQKTVVFHAKTTVDRFDYGLKWSKTTEAGGLVVSREIKVDVTAAFKVK